MKKSERNKMFDTDYYSNKYPTKNGFVDKKYKITIGDNFKIAIKNIGIADKESRERQIATAIQILSCCNPPWAQADTKKVGLVVGKVQSGKTTSFTTLSAAASDNGYRLIIHLLGTNNTLLESNLEDVEHILGLNERNTNWMPRRVSPKKQGGINISAKQLESILKSNPLSRRNTTEKIVYISLLKEKNHIQSLTKLLKAAKLQNYPELLTLIIDDEVDSHSIDISKPKETDSSINRNLKRLLDVAGTATYVGYTATSAAVKLSHQNNFICPDFHAVLYPGKGYIGNEDLFGKPKQWLSEKKIKNWKNPHQIHELAIKKTIGTSGKFIDDKDSLKASLREAVRDFLVTQEILGTRWEDSDEDPVFSMMLHPTNLTGKEALKEGHLTHEETIDELNHYLGFIIHAELKNNNTSSSTYKGLKKIFIEKRLNCRKKELKKFPKFKDVVSRITDIFDPNQSNKGSIYTVQGVNEYYPPKIKFENSDLWFLVGGNKLSRGLVVKGLLTTWLPIQPITALLDTMEQRGRFFGYKQGYLDLISIYLKPETVENFRNYLVYEAQQWRELEDNRDLGIPLPDSDASYVGAEGYHSLTSPTKRKRKYFTIFKKGWQTARCLPFSDNNGQPDKSVVFHSHIDAYIKGLKQANKLRPVPQKNKFNATTPLQRFKYSGVGIKDAYKDLLKPLLDPKFGLTGDDDRFRDCIKYISNMADEKIKCDIVLFDGPGQTRRFLKKDPANGINTHRWTGNYANGPGASRQFLAGSSYYCGDNRVLLHTDVDPLANPINLEQKNHNLTVQIHKIDGYIDDPKKPDLKGIYCIRVMLPRTTLYRGG